MKTYEAAFSVLGFACDGAVGPAGADVMGDNKTSKLCELANQSHAAPIQLIK